MDFLFSALFLKDPAGKWGRHRNDRTTWDRQKNDTTDKIWEFITYTSLILDYCPRSGRYPLFTIIPNHTDRHKHTDIPVGSILCQSMSFLLSFMSVNVVHNYERH